MSDKKQEDVEPQQKSESGVERVVIKPCPFCGKEAMPIYNFESVCKDTWDITCLGKDCICGEGLDWCLPKQQLIEMWNKRA